MSSTSATFLVLDLWSKSHFVCEDETCPPVEQWESLMCFNGISSLSFLVFFGLSSQMLKKTKKDPGRKRGTSRGWTMLQV